MHQKVLHALLLVVVLVLISGASYLLGTQNPATTDSTEDSEFTTYTSTALGFSMKIPKELPVLDRCEGNIEERVPVKVIEDVGEKIAYIVPEYFYEDKGKTPFNPDVGYESSGVCDKIVRTLSNLREETHSKKGITNPFVGWTMVVDNSPVYKEGLSQDYLTKFTRNIVGKKCVSVADYSYARWPQGEYKNLTYEIYEDQLPKDGPSYGEACVNPQGSAGLVKTRPGQHDLEAVAMVVMFSQEATFFVDGNDTTKGDYDEEMLRSFRFTD